MNSISSALAEAVKQKHPVMLDPSAPPSHVVLSLGAGVQSSTVALLAKHGELPMPLAAVFADTGIEPAATYRHLDWLATVLPFPIVRKADPEDWRKIVRLDRLIRTGVKGTTGELFLHDSRAPIDQAPLDRVSERGHWSNECAGICGV